MPRTDSETLNKLVELMELNNKLLQTIAITVVANSQADTVKHRREIIDIITALTYKDK